MPSEIKKLMVNEIDQNISSVSALVLVGMANLKSNESNTIRASAAEKNVRIMLLKNNLAGIVFSQHGMKGLDRYLVGPTAAIFGDDLIVLTKFVKGLAAEKAYAGKLELRGGWLSGTLCSASDVIALADMPPYEVMLMQVLATLSSPVNNLLGAISAPVSNILSVLEQVRDSKTESVAS